MYLAKLLLLGVCFLSNNCSILFENNEISNSSANYYGGLNK